MSHWHIQCTAAHIVLLGIFVNLSSSSQLIEFWRDNTTEATTAGSSYRCPDPPRLANGNYHGSRRTPGALIDYYCYPGYKIIGLRTFECLYLTPKFLDFNQHIELNWSPDFSNTHCMRMILHDKFKSKPVRSTCSLPMINPHFIVENWQSEYDIDSVISYTCPVGSELVGPSLRWCREGLHGGKPFWSPVQEPRCLDKDYESRTLQLPTYTYTKSNTLTLKQGILYVSIPCLVISAILSACKVSKRYRERNSQSASPLNSVDQNINSQQPATDPVTTNPSRESLNTGDFAVTILLLETESASIKQAPPSYEEATDDSSLPSFETAQKLLNSGSSHS